MANDVYEAIGENFRELDNKLTEQKFNCYISFPKDYEQCISLSFLSWLDKEDSLTVGDVLETLKTDDKTKCIYDFISDSLSKSIYSGIKEFSNKDLKECILKDNAEFYIKHFFEFISLRHELGYLENPESLPKLAVKLLDIQDNDNVADFCAAVGDFATVLKVHYPKVEVTSYESKLVLVQIGTIIKYMNNLDFELVQQDLLTDEVLNKDGFSKLYCDMPILIREDINGKNKNLASSILGLENGETGSTVLSGKLFYQKIIESLKENGKAVIVAAAAYVTSSTYKEFWKKILNSDNPCYINTVIQLASNLVPGTSSPITMIILTKENNDSIKMIDALNEYEAGRLHYSNTLSDDNIANIYNAYTEKKNIANVKVCEISLSDIKDNECNITPYYWCNGAQEEGDNTLSELCTITRGLQLSKDKLDKLKWDETSEGKKFYYLPQTGIKDNSEIDFDNLSQLNINEKINNAYILQENDIVLCSAKMHPLRLSYVTKSDIQDTDIIASSNIYVIRVDHYAKCFEHGPYKELKDNGKLFEFLPYYIMACLEKESTYEYIVNMDSGIRIYAQTLQNLNIPLKTAKELRDFVDKYTKYYDNINTLNKKLKEEKDKMSNLLSTLDNNNGNDLLII